MTSSASSAFLSPRMEGTSVEQIITMSVDTSSAESTRSLRPGSVSTTTYLKERCRARSTPLTCSEVISSASAGFSGAHSV